MRRSLRAVLLLQASILFFPLFADGRLTGSNLDVEDNSLEVHTADDGLIDFIKATYNPGAGITNIYGLDVAASPSLVHGIGIVTGEWIKQTGPGSFAIKGDGVPVAAITFESAGIRLLIGDECYFISKPKDFLVEVRPLVKDGKPDPSRRFAYRVSLAHGGAFLGVVEKTYIPSYAFPPPPSLDLEAIYYPLELKFGNGKLEAYSYQVDGNGYPSFGYTISFELSKDRSVNLANYLILLTRRAREPRYPMIHAVLLTLYFYDALMP
jgi:hypothetical protein